MTTASASLDQLRDQLTRRILWIGLVPGLVVAVPSVWYAAVAGAYAVAVIDVGAVLFTALLLATPGISPRLRAIGLMALLTGLAAGLGLAVGTIGVVFLVAVPVLGAILLSVPGALTGLTAGAALLALAGWLGGPALRADLLGVTDPVEWTVVSLNVLFVAAVMSMSAGVLLQRLGSAVAVQARTSEALATEAAEHEQARVQVSRLAAAIEQARDALLVVEPSGQVRYANRLARTVLEAAAPSETGPDDLLALIAHPSERQTVERDLAAARAVRFLVEVEIDGRRTLLDAQATPLPTEDRWAGGGVVAVLRDVTTDREEEIRRRERAKAASIATLASGTAHDFNNVLGTIRAVAETAAERAGDQATHADLATILEACDRAADVVDPLMALGEQRDRPRHPTSVTRAVREGVAMVRPRVPAHVRVIVTASDDALVSARAADLQRIVTNLVKNAVHAVAERPTGTVTIQVSRAGTQVTITVDDDGPGIGTDAAERLFDPFYTTRDQGEGRGLGLTSVRTIVDSLGGAITVERSPIGGARFAVSLPTAAGTTTDAMPREAVPPSSDEAPAGVTILLVDDEQVLRELAADALRRHGHTVLVAADGAEALEVVDRHDGPIDALVTDLTMPRLDGVALTRELRSRMPGLPVVLCSGFPDASRTGALDHQQAPTRELAKPFALAELISTVHEVLAADVERT